MSAINTSQKDQNLEHVLAIGLMLSVQRFVYKMLVGLADLKFSDYNNTNICNAHCVSKHTESEAHLH